MQRCACWLCAGRLHLGSEACGGSTGAELHSPTPARRPPITNGTLCPSPPPPPLSPSPHPTTAAAASASWTSCARRAASSCWRRAARRPSPPGRPPRRPGATCQSCSCTCAGATAPTQSASSGVFEQVLKRARQTGSAPYRGHAAFLLAHGCPGHDLQSGTAKRCCVCDCVFSFHVVNMESQPLAGWCSHHSKACPAGGEGGGLTSSSPTAIPLLLLPVGFVPLLAPPLPRSPASCHPAAPCAASASPAAPAAVPAAPDSVRYRAAYSRSSLQGGMPSAGRNTGKQASEQSRQRKCK